MHLKFPYFTYLHLSRTITRIACKILSCTRNLLRKVIKKKKNSKIRGIYLASNRCNVLDAK